MRTPSRPLPSRSSTSQYGRSSRRSSRLASSSVTSASILRLSSGGARRPTRPTSCCRGFAAGSSWCCYGVELVVESYARPERGRAAHEAERASLVGPFVDAEVALRVGVQAAIVLLYLLVPWGKLQALRRYKYDEAAPNSAPYEARKHALAKYDCPAVGPQRSVYEVQRAYEKTSVGLNLAAAPQDIQQTLAVTAAEGV